MPNEIHFNLRLRTPEQNLQKLLGIPLETMDWRRDLKKIIAVGKDAYDYCWSQKYPNLRYRNIIECLNHYAEIAERLNKATKNLSLKLPKFTKLGFLSFLREKQKKMGETSPTLVDKLFEEKKEEIIDIFCKHVIEEYPARSPEGQIHFKDYQDCVKQFSDHFQTLNQQGKQNWLWYLRDFDLRYSYFLIFFQIFTLLNYSILGLGVGALIYQGIQFLKTKKIKNSII